MVVASPVVLALALLVQDSLTRVAVPLTSSRPLPPST